MFGIYLLNYNSTSIHSRQSVKKYELLKRLRFLYPISSQLFFYTIVYACLLHSFWVRSCDKFSDLKVIKTCLLNSNCVM